MTPLPGSRRALRDEHDAILLDLDGTVYVGDEAIPGAGAAVSALRTRGLRCLFVTNNASRRASVVAAGLEAMGIAAAEHEVVTSAQAAAAMLAADLVPDAAVLVVGGDGLVSAVRAVGLRPVTHAASVLAVVQGFAPEVGWPELAEATYAIRAGADWVATNRDLTLPTSRGLAPGNGTLVEVVRLATGVEPRVAGKPELPLLQLALQRSAATSPLVVGDRLDTDIEWAVRGGVASLLVLTGVTDIAALLSARPGQRPTHIGRGLESLAQIHPPVLPVVRSEQVNPVPTGGVPGGDVERRSPALRPPAPSPAAGLGPAPAPARRPAPAPARGWAPAPARGWAPAPARGLGALAGWRCADWTATVAGSILQLHGTGPPENALRAACGQAWARADAGSPVDLAPAVAAVVSAGLAPAG